MKFSQIYDRPVAKIPLTELYAFFHEHAFFKFMDAGREGLKHAAQDTIDNYTTWIMARGPFGRGNFREVLIDDYLKLNQEATRLMVNGFVTGGTGGLMGAVQQIYLLTLDALIEANPQN